MQSRRHALAEMEPTESMGAVNYLPEDSVCIQSSYAWLSDDTVPEFETVNAAPRAELKGQHELRVAVARIFASCDLPSITLAGAQAQLGALCARFPVAFVDAVLYCTEVILGTADAHAGRGRASEMAMELLVAAAQKADVAAGRAITVQLLERVLGLLGGMDGLLAPRARSVRHRCAELLWRLLSATPPEEPRESPHRARAIEAAVLGLSRDKAPAVRHAIVPGLSLLGGPRATEALVGLAAADAVSKVRALALAQLQQAACCRWEPQHGAAGCRHLALLAGRALDAAAAVRCRLFAALSALPGVPEATVAEGLLRVGLADGSASVRRECECMLRVWAEHLRDGGGEGIEGEGGTWGGEGALRALLALVSRLGARDTQAQEAAAEMALQHLLLRPEWEAAAEASVQMLLASEEEMMPEQVFIARVSLSLHADCPGVSDTAPGPALLRRALAALDGDGTFELRQLLLVLLGCGLPESPAARRSVLHVATAVLLRAAPEVPPCRSGWGAWARHPGSSVAVPAWSGASGSSVCGTSAASALHLAVVLARRALGAEPRLASVPPEQAEAQFSHAMLVILKVLQGPPHVDGADPQAGTKALDALGVRLESLLEDARRVAGRIEDLRARKRLLVGTRDYQGACRVQEGLAEMEAHHGSLEAAAERTAQELGVRMHRVLGIIEAVLTHSRADFSCDVEMSHLLQDVLRPALMCRYIPPALAVLHLGACPLHTNGVVHTT
uniref:Sister chromatid cohesion protein n=1 Tax=Alexandrium monilatum TaxID=311494 RepID=A0A7S4QUZ4_9DINO